MPAFAFLLWMFKAYFPVVFLSLFCLFFLGDGDPTCTIGAGLPLCLQLIPDIISFYFSHSLHWTAHTAIICKSCCQGILCLCNLFMLLWCWWLLRQGTWQYARSQAGEQMSWGAKGTKQFLAYFTERTLDDWLSLLKSIRSGARAHFFNQHLLLAVCNHHILLFDYIHENSRRSGLLNTI